MKLATTIVAVPLRSARRAGGSRARARRGRSTYTVAPVVLVARSAVSRSRLTRFCRSPARVGPVRLPLDGSGAGSATAGISPASSGHARLRPEPLALARQVAAGDPALRRALLPLARLPGADGGRVLRDPRHRPLPTRDLRLQRGGAALDLAGGLLLVRRARHRPLPAVHARRGAGLPGDARAGLPGAALARARAREVVAASHPPVHRRRGLPRRRLRGSGSD